MLYRRFVEEEKLTLFCVESICNDQSIVTKCVKEIKSTSPDYKNSNFDSAIKDFNTRIKNYELSYVPIDEEESHLSFLKIIDQGRHHIINKLHGFIPSRIVHYLMNSHVIPRKIYITKPAETVDDTLGVLGGDDYEFTEKGEAFKERLNRFVENQKIDKLCVWTSLLKRSYHTADQLNCPKVHWKALNEINYGIYEGSKKGVLSLTQNDSFPRGESYRDLIYRLEPVIIELERQADVLLICHISVARCLMAYFLDVPFDQANNYDIPDNCVRVLTPIAYGCRTEDIFLN